MSSFFARLPFGERRFQTVAGLALFFGALAATALEAGIADTRLVVTILDAVPRESSDPSDEAQAPESRAITVSVEHQQTGETWSVECPRKCRFPSLPRGLYRLVARDSGTDDRQTVTDVPLRDAEITFVQVAWRPGRHQHATRDLLVPPTEPWGSTTLVSVRRAGDVPWPIVDACTTVAARLTNPRFWWPRQSDDPLWGVQAWGTIARDWWGSLHGTVRDPRGWASAGIPIAVEYVGAPGDESGAVPHVSLRTADTGCYGGHGLWPGRYRVWTDAPPFTFEDEVDVTSDGIVWRDVALQVAPQTSPSREELARLVDGWARTASTRARPAAEAPAVVPVAGTVTWMFEDWTTVSRMPGVEIVFEREEDDRHPSIAFKKWTAMSDVDGYYRIELPEGRYRLTVERPPSERVQRVQTRIQIAREGHALLEAGGFKGPGRSGLYVPALTLQSGLLAHLHVGLVLRVDEKSSALSPTVTVSGGGRSDLPAPLAGNVPRSLFEPSGDSPFDTPHARLGAGRTIQSIHELFQGIVYTERVGTLAQFTAAGQRRLANRMIIDGISADLAIALMGHGIEEAGSGALPAFGTSGGTQTLVPLSAIADVEVRTSSTASPQYAQTPGAQTAIVTRAGGNRFSGAAFADVRPDGLAATDWFDNANGVDRTRKLWTSGASVGGPLSPRAGMTYFAAWEQQRIDRSLTMTALTPSLALREETPATLRPLLDAFPLPNGRDLGEGLAEFTGRIPATSDLTTLNTRVDLNGPKHRFFARLNHGRSQGDALTDFRQSPFVSFDNTEKTATTSATAVARIIAQALVHDLRVNVTTHRGSLEAGTASYGGGQPLPWDLLAPLGAGPDSWIRFHLFSDVGGFLISGRSDGASQQQMQVVDTWTLLRGRHEWTFGLDYRRVVAESDPAPDRYTYRFDDLAMFFEGRPRLAVVEHLAPAKARLERWSAFAQDSFRVSPRLSLEYGVRYSVKPAPVSVTDVAPVPMDYDALPAAVPLPDGTRLWRTSWTDFAPRLAASYRFSSAADRDSTLRASWSLSFDERTSGTSPFGRGYPYISTRALRRPEFPLTEGELARPSPAPGPTTEYFSFPHDFRSPRTYQWQLGLEQALGRGQRLSLAYAGAAGRDLIYWSGYYLGAGGIGPRISAFSNDAVSDYNALLVEYVRRLLRGLSGRITYMWSHAIDTDSGEAAEPHLPLTIGAPDSNRGSSDFDRRHVLNLAASYSLPVPQVMKPLRAICADWRVDVVARVQSGAPMTVTVFRNFGFGGYRVRPDVVPGESVWIDDSSSPGGRRLNAEAFEISAEPRQGALGRNPMRADGVRQVDLSLSRTIQFAKNASVRVRVDVFNVLNIPTFGPPQTDLSLPTFGQSHQSYASALGAGTLSLGGLAPMQQPGGPRAIQLGVRLVWSLRHR